MDDIERSSGEIRLEDGLHIYYRTWQIPRPTVAHLTIMHGYSDHSGLYDLFATYLASRYSLLVTAFDRRGWGRSVRSRAERGDMGSTSVVLSDLDQILEQLNKTWRNLPFFVMAHSMGGLDLLTYLLSSSRGIPARTKIDGIVLDAPYIALANPPSSLKVLTGRFVSIFLPKLQLKNDPGSQPPGLCRDPDVVNKWLNDEMCHDLGTLEAFQGILERESDLTNLSKGYSVSKLRSSLPCSVFWAHGTADGAVRFDTSRDLYNVLHREVSMEHSIFTSFQDSYHQLHAEPEGVWQKFADLAGEWIASWARSVN